VLAVAGITAGETGVVKLKSGTGTLRFGSGKPWEGLIAGFTLLNGVEIKERLEKGELNAGLDGKLGPVGRKCEGVEG
jgi:hypothetical protein